MFGSRLVIPRRAPIPSKGRMTGPGPTYGITFIGNNISGSSIRLVWDGANLLSRTTQTVIWKARYFQMTGYYAVIWNSSANGTFYGDTYEFGTHPFPCDGTFNSGTGQMLVPTAGSGTVHYEEIAGLGSKDYIASPGGTNIPKVVDVWRTSARTVKLITVSTTDDTVEHIYYPDISQPTVYIRQLLAVASLDNPTGGAGMFSIGSSPWRDNSGGGDGITDESPGCSMRGIKLFNAGMTIGDIALEDASGLNTAVTAAGIASTWYMNMNPTPSDVSDKSGAGHSPSWANANRPTLYTG